MDHIGTQTMETPRLILRRFVRTDAEAMYRNWASDPEVTKYLTWPAYRDVSAAHQILDMWEKEYMREDYYQWAIELKELGQPIGSISAVHLVERANAVEIGYCIGKKWWGRGITTEAMRAVLDFFFQKVGANRVCARHDTKNPASGTVMRKCGMICEGTMRQSDWNNQGICDISCYAILASERNPG